MGATERGSANFYSSLGYDVDLSLIVLNFFRFPVGYEH